MSTSLDIVIVITIVAATYFGWRLGILRTGMPLAGIGAGIFLANHSSPQLAQYVGQFVDDQDLAQTISLWTVVLGLGAISIVLGVIMRRVFQFVFLGWLDGTAGAVTGLALILVVWSVGLNYAGPALGEAIMESVDRAPLAGTILREGPTLLDATPDFVKGYAEDLGNRL